MTPTPPLRKLPDQNPGQAKTLLMLGGVEYENGQWFSPDAVREYIAEALSQRGETCASASVAGLKVVIDETMRPDEMKLAQPATQCPLTECQGRPRCERCIAMDAKATQPSPATERAGLVALHTMREAQQAAAVPAGWKLVPVEPTQEMLSKSWLAVGGALDRENQRAFYSTMLSSAPEAPQAQGWLPIETAPKDGTYVLVSNGRGVWVARFKDVYESGWRPACPWQSMMLNHDHIPQSKRRGAPTRWQPLPAPPVGIAGGEGG